MIYVCIYQKYVYLYTIEITNKKIIETMETINYNGMEITYNESQTVGNCIDLGFSTEKTKEIINDLRLQGVDYLGKRKLEKYRD